MNKTGWILAVLIIPIMAGCQQAQQQNTADISRKDRLLADENMRLRSELVQCQNKLKKQEKMLEQYRQENKEMTQKADNAVGENQSLKREAAQYRSEIEKQKQLLEQYQQMLDSKDDPALCRNKIERQKKLLAKCRQENERIQIEAGQTSKFLMEQLPAEMMKEVERLTQENEQLKARIEELEKTAGH
jgi:chromosome segregation ATPase